MKETRHCHNSIVLDDSADETEDMKGVPKILTAELAQDIANRIRDAVEVGDVTTLNAIAEEINTQSDSCVPLSKQIIQMAQDFDLDGIQKLANALNAS